MNAKRIHRGDSAGNVFPLAVGLPLAMVILLVTKIYFVRELLVLLAALAVLFLLGTGVAILFLVVQECGKWSLRRFKEAKHETVLSLRGRVLTQRGTSQLALLIIAPLPVPEVDSPENDGK